MPGPPPRAMAPSARAGHSSSAFLPATPTRNLQQLQENGSDCCWFQRRLKTTAPAAKGKRKANATKEAIKNEHCLRAPSASPAPPGWSGPPTPVLSRAPQEPARPVPSFRQRQTAAPRLLPPAVQASRRLPRNHRPSLRLPTLPHLPRAPSTGTRRCRQRPLGRPPGTGAARPGGSVKVPASGRPQAGQHLP